MTCEVPLSLTDEALVDFQRIEGEILQIGKRRVAGAEIIQRKPCPQLTQTH